MAKAEHSDCTNIATDATIPFGAVSEHVTTPQHRRMSRTALLGQHTHHTAVGVDVHIYTRGKAYLARGRYEGNAFGETLGDNLNDSACRLRHLMVEIENGSFVRSSERTRRQLRRGAPPRLDLRSLCDEYLTEKRAVLGRDTTRTYETRLRPVIVFAEQPTSRKRWPMAADMDRDFAVGLRTFLHQRQVSRNGRLAAAAKPMAPRQVHNVLDCMRTLVGWAVQPAVHRLPAAMANPFTPDLVGRRQSKDPLRLAVFPLESRVALVSHMELWQLLHLSWRLVLPLRPEDFSGLLISDVDISNCLLRFGPRYGDADFNKGRQAFSCPFPVEMAGLIQHCMAGRAAGPVLRQRGVFAGRRPPRLEVGTAEDVTHHIESALGDAGPGELQSPQDAKRIVRGCLRRMGGVSEDDQWKELKVLFLKAGLGSELRPYDLRGSVNTEMEAAGVSLLVQRYVTGHATNDIQNEYVSLDPQVQMRKYFDALGHLFEAIQARSLAVGLTPTRPEDGLQTGPTAA